LFLIKDFYILGGESCGRETGQNPSFLYFEYFVSLIFTRQDSSRVEEG
jgi:hypothetical protein